jgi:high-affinity K+ transport system ATPase subunit B
MKLNILICILLLAIVLTNASKSKAKSKAKSKSKSKKFLTVKTDNKSKDPEGNPVSVIPTTTNLNDDDSIVVVE